MTLDVLDDNYVWQRGMVKHIRKSVKKQTEYIQVQLSKKCLIIDTNEKRFHSLGYYTDRPSSTVQYMDYGKKLWQNWVLSEEED